MPGGGLTAPITGLLAGSGPRSSGASADDGQTVGADACDTRK